MNVSFSVAMMLQAVNNMGPGIQSAQRTIQGLGQTIQNVARQASNLNPVQGWEAKIQGAVRQIKELQKQTENLEKSASKMRNNGFENVATGVAIGLPFMDMVKKASDRQVSQKMLSQAGMSQTDITAINDKAKSLSTELMFSVNELLSIPLAMQRAGMNADKIQNSFQQIAYLTELEHLRTGADAYSIAKNLAQMAEQAGVTGDQKQLSAFMEAVNRVATVTTADVNALHESSKYFTTIGRQYGITPEDIMMHQGIAARLGLEGSISGTSIKDFIQRLNPEYSMKMGGGTKEALADMDALGWLTNAQHTVTKAGREKFSSAGTSIFFDDKGNVKPFIEVAKIMADTYKKFATANPGQEGANKYRAYMKNIVGQEGLTYALGIGQNADAIDKMYADYQRVKSINDSVKEFQQTFKQTFGAFITNIENIGVEAVTQLMHDLTDGMKAIGPYVEGVGKWVESHRELTNTIVRSVVGLSAFLITLGTVKIVLGTVGKLMLGGFSFGAAPIRWILSLLSSLFNLKTFFNVLRLEGAGFWSALWKGAQAAWPWLGKISGWVNRFVLQWAIAAVRIAAGWLIAMGPVGWIILGVTAIIAAAVWAWNNNFMGFRDKCTAAWNWIKDYAEYIWPGISQGISDFVASAKNKWNDFKNYTSECWEKIKSQAQPALEYMDPIIKFFTDNWKKYFGGVGEAAKNMLDDMWNAQTGVQIINGVKNHFTNFDKWRDARDQAVQNGSVDTKLHSMYSAPYIPQASNTNNINQTVNVNVPTTGDANKFVSKLEPLEVPGRYIDSRNPSYEF